MMHPKENRKRAVTTYISVPDISNVEINFPALIRHLGEIQEKTILDYGCGFGAFARQLKKMGAEQVIATDTSAAIIKLAEAADPHSAICYHHMPENSLRFLQSDSVDKAIANLVFMMAPTAHEIAESMQEIQRVLCSGGRFVYLITHPCFIEKGAHDYSNVFENGFHYMKEGTAYRFVLQDSDGNDVDEEFVDYHHTLTTYLSTTLQAGFRLVSFEELSYPDEIIDRYGTSRTFQTFPQAIVIECIKP